MGVAAIFQIGTMSRAGRIDVRTVFPTGWPVGEGPGDPIPCNVEIAVRDLPGQPVSKGLVAPTTKHSAGRSTGQVATFHQKDLASIRRRLSHHHHGVIAALGDHAVLPLLVLPLFRRLSLAVTMATSTWNPSCGKRMWSTFSTILRASESSACSAVLSSANLGFQGTSGASVRIAIKPQGSNLCVMLTGRFVGGPGVETKTRVRENTGLE